MRHGSAQPKPQGRGARGNRYVADAARDPHDRGRLARQFLLTPRRVACAASGGLMTVVHATCV